jgi:hypothetical protein
MRSVGVDRADEALVRQLVAMVGVIDPTSGEVRGDGRHTRLR